jgi:hypothetical protein
VKITASEATSVKKAKIPNINNLERLFSFQIGGRGLKVFLLTNMKRTGNPSMLYKIA